MIDWTDQNSSVTPHFTVGDCLMLHSWSRLATQVDGADFSKLEILCQKMEEIRKILQCPINVHCMFRSEAYNASQNIKPNDDVHSMNLACDFDCFPYLSIQAVKNILLPKLEQIGIRMEQNTTTWVHIDLREPGPSGRYFLP